MNAIEELNKESATMGWIESSKAFTKGKESGIYNIEHLHNMFNFIKKLAKNASKEVQKEIQETIPVEYSFSFYPVDAYDAKSNDKVVSFDDYNERLLNTSYNNEEEHGMKKIA